MQCLCEIGSRQDTSLKARENVAKALMYLTNSDRNRYIMTSPNVLDTLIYLASNFSYEVSQPAVTSIARLASEPKNRKGLSSHKGLITALAAAVEIEAELKRNGSAVVTIAKPALVTLLMALS